MQLVKCKNGHVYDADKLKSCPHCDGIIKNLDVKVDTYGKGQTDIPTEVSAAKAGVHLDDIEMRKQVGILVAVSGVYEGKAFALYDGINRIGRAGNLEVSLSGDDMVSRTGHASIIFDNGCFDIAPLKSGREVLVNGKSIHEQTKISDRDKIKIGDSIFSLIIFDDVYNS